MYYSFKIMTADYVVSFAQTYTAVLGEEHRKTFVIAALLYTAFFVFSGKNTILNLASAR